MRIFLAGGTGVLGTRLIPELTAAGHPQRHRSPTAHQWDEGQATVAATSVSTNPATMIATRA